MERERRRGEGNHRTGLHGIDNVVRMQSEGTRRYLCEEVLTCEGYEIYLKKKKRKENMAKRSFKKKERRKKKKAWLREKTNQLY